MMKSRRDILRASAFGVVAGAGVFNARAQGPASLKPVKVATSIPVVGSSPQFLVKTLKFDNKHGLDVELLQMGGNSSLMVDAVISGNATFATPGTITVLQAIRQGAPIMIIGAYCNNQIAAVISKAALAKLGVPQSAPAPDKIKAMKGLTIGTNPVGATYTQMFRAYLTRYGLDPDKDVRLVGIADTPALVAGIHQGRFDAIVSGAGIVEQAITLGSADMWLSGASGEIPGAETEMVAIAIARADTVEKSPELVDAFLASMQDSLNVLNNDRVATGALLQKEFFNKLDPAVWKLVWDGMAKGFPATLKFPKTAFDYWTANDPKGADSYKDVDYARITYKPSQAR